MEGNSNMSSKKHGVQTPSTVEAIRMASASILGTTTSKGYPLGSATGSGSMMEENSESVALSVTPLIFSLRDDILISEGLDMLSLEWDLERPQSQEVLPEHLIIAGGKSGAVASHVCALSWEAGVIDPFRMDTYIGAISKKISDVEKAVLGNSLDYETDGLAVLKRYSDRLNNVTFVEMLDRQFQETWESQKLKLESVDIETVLTYAIRDDYSSNPPGPMIQRRVSSEYRLPVGAEEQLLVHLKNRLVSPKGLETITLRIPDVGREILSELNAYAYSIEEVDIARGTITALSSYLGKNEVRPSELDSLSSQTNQFTDSLSEVSTRLSDILEKHATSGLRLTIQGHHDILSKLVNDGMSSLNALQTCYAQTLLEGMMGSIHREFSDSDEIRAWELKGIFTYFATFTKRVLNYIGREFQEFLLINSVQRVMKETLQEFRDEGEKQSKDKAELLLFHKFFAELYSLLNAIIDRKSFEGSEHRHIEPLVEDITQEISDEFRKIDVWDLVDFTDLAEIARTEIQSRDVAEGSSISNESLITLLTEFETFVSETLPDVGDTFLSRKMLATVIDQIPSDGTSLASTLKQIVEGETEKPEEWKREASLWISRLADLVGESVPLSKQLFTFMKLCYEELGEGATPEAVLQRTQESAEELESSYQQALSDWESTCSRIESENKPIRESNAKREALLNEAVRRYEADLNDYQLRLEAHKAQVAAQQLEAPIADSSLSLPVPPTMPESLEARKSRIDRDYPLMTEMPLPAKPEPSGAMLTYAELRDVLVTNLEKMKRSQERMEQVFTLRLRALKSEGTKIAEEISIGIGEEFLEYLMNARIRKLGQLLPRAKRAYLRNPADPSVVYLVNYEFNGENMIVSIGSNLLRRG
jgi:hypothetical protein